MYILHSDQESSYNLSKNLLLLPRILKLIVDMVDDITPLLKGNLHLNEDNENNINNEPMKTMKPTAIIMCSSA